MSNDKRGANGSGGVRGIAQDGINPKVIQNVLPKTPPSPPPSKPSSEKKGG